jgi:hypothetical protein
MWLVPVMAIVRMMRFVQAQRNVLMMFVIAQAALALMTSLIVMRRVMRARGSPVMLMTNAIMRLSVTGRRNVLKGFVSALMFMPAQTIHLFAIQA